MLGGISDVFVVTQGYHRELIFLPEFAKKSSVKQVQVFRKSQELMCGRTIHCERPSACRLARFTSRCKVSLSVMFCEFPQELRIRDTINMSFGTIHNWLEHERPSCPETFRYVLQENKRLPCSLCVALWHVFLFACTTFSARVIFTSSEDLPEKSVALVPWLWAEPVRTCALPRSNANSTMSSTMTMTTAPVFHRYDSIFGILLGVESVTANQWVGLCRDLCCGGM